MIDFSAVAAVFSVYIVGVVIPGPNFVAVAHKSVSATRPDAFALVAGIVVVNLFGPPVRFSASASCLRSFRGSPLA